MIQLFLQSGGCQSYVVVCRLQQGTGGLARPLMPSWVVPDRHLFPVCMWGIYACSCSWGVARSVVLLHHVLFPRPHRSMVMTQSISLVRSLDDKLCAWPISGRQDVCKIPLLTFFTSKCQKPSFMSHFAMNTLFTVRCTCKCIDDPARGVSQLINCPFWHELYCSLVDQQNSSSMA